MTNYKNPDNWHAQYFNPKIINRKSISQVVDTHILIDIYHKKIGMNIESI